MPNEFQKVSIIVATYNCGRTLKKVLDAMLKLDYPAEYEIIVANDGSTDNTEDILLKYAGRKKIMVLNLLHAGVCRARNAAIKAARFPIVINMDHDCIPEKDWLKKMVAGFENSKVGVVSGYAPYGGTSTGFRKELLDKVGGYDEQYVYYREDTDLSFKIMDLGYEFKMVDAKYEHDHKMAKPAGKIAFMKHAMQRLKYHMNDVLLYKKHPTKACREFLNIKAGFIVNPAQDFRVATGTWEEGKGMRLSSPRGMTFMENKTPLHTIAIIIGGIGYVFAVKIARFCGSVKYGKLLI